MELGFYQDLQCQPGDIKIDHIFLYQYDGDPRVMLLVQVVTSDAETTARVKILKRLNVPDDVVIHTANKEGDEVDNVRAEELFLLCDTDDVHDLVFGWRSEGETVADLKRLPLPVLHYLADIWSDLPEEHAIETACKYGAKDVRTK